MKNNRFGNSFFFCFLSFCYCSYLSLIHFHCYISFICFASCLNLGNPLLLLVLLLFMLPLLLGRFIAIISDLCDRRQYPTRLTEEEFMRFSTFSIMKSGHLPHLFSCICSSLCIFHFSTSVPSCSIDRLHVLPFYSL